MSTDTPSRLDRGARHVSDILTRDQVTIHGLLLFIVAVVVTPVVFAFIFSTQTLHDVLIIENIVPGSAGFENYVDVLTEWNFLQYMRNSFLMATFIVVGKLVFAIMAATAIVYYDFPYKDAVFFFILLTLMFPLKLRMVPLYDLMATLEWTNTLWAVTVPYLSSATTVFLLRQYFLSIPDPLVENARLDGVGPVRFMVFVVLPMAKAFLAGVAVIRFIGAWNQYLWPLVVINRNEWQVVQVGIRYLRQAGDGAQTEWQLLMAGAIIALVPPLLMLIAMHRPLLNTMTLQSK